MTKGQPAKPYYLPTREEIAEATRKIREVGWVDEKGLQQPARGECWEDDEDAEVAKRLARTTITDLLRKHKDG